MSENCLDAEIFQDGKSISSCRAGTSFKSGDNQIVVNMSPYGFSKNSQNDVQAVIAVPDKAVRLDVNTSTDWGIVLLGVVGIISTIAAAKFAAKTQRDQIKANIANMRQRWLEDLRQCAVDFSQKAVYIINHLQDDRDFIESKEMNMVYSELLAAESKLSLMLDMKHDKHRRIFQTAEDLIHIVKLHARDDPPTDEFRDKMDEFREDIREVLEDAWASIKSDLMNGQSGFWGGFPNPTRRS